MENNLSRNIEESLINQSIKVFLEWAKWHCHCNVYYRLNVSNKSQETIDRMSFQLSLEG